jgi:hypothetical protein
MSSPATESSPASEEEEIRHLRQELELTFADGGWDQTGLSLEANLTRSWVESAVGDSRMQVESPDAPGVVGSVGDFRNREIIRAGFVTANRQIGRFPCSWPSAPSRRRCEGSSAPR